MNADRDPREVLRPCPFCGSADVKLFFTRDGAERIEYAQCQDCTTCGPDHTKGRHWNEFTIAITAEQDRALTRAIVDAERMLAAPRAGEPLSVALSALAAPAAEHAVPVAPEFCCEHAWRAAKDAAWKARDLRCDCDHNESCLKCYPAAFREGGKWHAYRAAAPTKGDV
jgi:hypothetical protein